MDEIKQLKIKAYDLLVLLENAKKEFDAVNLRIHQLSQTQIVEDVKPESEAA